ncbi:hypothetical protein [Crocosphaera sp.]|uniref:hypothetical protein n=1 Tax=Crocosphaera sp. TaxID=2729996 RepID=UPI003F212211
MTTQKIEGYWYGYSSSNQKYPIPQPNVLSTEETDTIYQLIVAKEKEASIQKYRGLTISRITGEMLGYTEYHHNSGWVWPGDFAKHYVKEHKVKPTDEFLKFIGYDE